MKASIWLVILVYSSSLCALEHVFWDNFNKAFNVYNTQIKKTCQSMKALQDENEKLGGKGFLLDEIKNIRPVLWLTQKEKPSATGYIDVVDGLTPQNLIGTLLKHQNKKEEEIKSLKPFLQHYFENMLEAMKKGKVLAKTYSELMGAVDDAPASLPRQIKKIVGASQGGAQVAIAWKKSAEQMMRQQCDKECSNDILEAKKCINHFEFREGAAAYLAEFDRADKCLDPIRVYSEMKGQAIELLQSQCDQTLKKDYDSLEAAYKFCNETIGLYENKVVKLKKEIKALKKDLETGQCLISRRNPFNKRT